MDPIEQAKQLSNHGAALKNAGQSRAAAIHFRRAIALWPENGLLWENLGATLWDLDEHQAALAAYAEAAKLGGFSHKNLGLIYASLGRFRDAEAEFRLAAMKNPDDAGARWSLSQLHLSLGDYRRGFSEYESRFDYLGQAFFAKTPYPEWNGADDLNGKAIMITPEQGAGDCILMSRYFSVLKERYPRVRIVHMVNPALQSLFWAFRDIIETIPMAVPWPDDIDYFCHMMSLPHRLGTTIDSIPPDPGRIRDRIGRFKHVVQLPEPNLPSLKVGLRWTGNPEQKQNPYRSIPLDTLADLCDLPNVCFYSLQVGHGADDVHRLGYTQIINDLSPELERGGYVATATAMLHLDLVITTCTSVAHLAGAMGVPTWLLACSDAYWVWTRWREDNPWYPTVRVFRQEQAGKWREVVERVKSSLTLLAANRVADAA